MFVYQNATGEICVTFVDSKPVEAPEYVIAIDEAAKKLYMVSGTIEPMPESDEEVVEETVVVETPKVEELDNVVENDAKTEKAQIGKGTQKAPKVEELDDITENDAQ